jgi:hypothetical protein
LAGVIGTAWLGFEVLFAGLAVFEPVGNAGQDENHHEDQQTLE